jgi:DNA-binding response OmpR family regulator
VATILVIDDDPLARELIARALRREGHEPLLAPDGRRGLALFRDAAPDLVITDIIMPDTEGIETIREMRGLRPDAKIIAISGGGLLPRGDLLSLAAKFGASEIMAKPFEPAELLAQISRCLGS